LGAGLPPPVLPIVAIPAHDTTLNTQSRRCNGG
jgi:hypothetical protein